MIMPSKAGRIYHCLLQPDAEVIYTNTALLKMPLILQFPD